MIDSCLKYLDAPSHKPLAYLLRFVYSLSLAICLRVTGQTMDHVSPEGHVQLLSKVSNKL
jgi:hypothetical protein